MADSKTFQELSLDKLVSTAEQLSRDDWRSVQMLCTSTESGIDMTYTFAKDDTLANYQIRGVTSEDTVPSIQHLFLGSSPLKTKRQTFWASILKAWCSTLLAGSTIFLKKIL